MYKVLRPFRYRGKQYNSGDEVDASRWPSKKYFLARRRIVQTSADVVEIPKPNLENMTRAELNEYATFLGIDDAEDFPNKGALIEAIRNVEPEEAPVTPSDDPEVEETEELEEEETDDDDADEADDSEEDDDADDSGDEDSDDQDSAEDESGDAEVLDDDGSNDSEVIEA